MRKTKCPIINYFTTQNFSKFLMYIILNVLLHVFVSMHKLDDQPQYNTVIASLILCNQYVFIISDTNVLICNRKVRGTCKLVRSKTSHYNKIV